MSRRTSTAHGERTLGVMPLYHTMGVRSLIAMSLIGGAFVCLPRFDVGARARPDRRREDHQSLSRADALSRPPAPRALQGDRRQLRAQARLCRRADDRRPAQGAASRVQARPVRQSLRLVGDLHLHHRPERAGEARLGRPRRHQPDGPRGAARRGVARRYRQGRRGRRDHRAARPATNPSRATGGGRKPTPRRCATAGTSPATPAISTPTATCSSPAGSTT